MSMAEPVVSKRAWSRNPLFVGMVSVVVALIGAFWLAAPRRSESTDNAYLQADSSVVAPKVRGLVADVLVQHNQRVHRGDPLVRIDAEEFDARVASARASLQNARAGVAAATSALVTLSAEEQLSVSSIRAAQSSIRSFAAQQSLAEADRRRYDNLVLSGAVARRDVDQYHAAEVTAQANADHSRAALSVSRDEARVTTAKRQTLDANVAQAEAAVATARAALDLALQDQGNTLIRAPVDGVVGDRQVERGDYVQPGTRMLSVVPIDAMYVVANFKETQTARMMIGQRVQVDVDALPGQHLAGRVDSFSPGSGSQFSLLPFEPGTGNFTKIVQRVPVRIQLEPGQPALERLRAGLSSTVTVALDSDASSRQAAR